MNNKIKIYFNLDNIKEHIKDSILTIKNESFKIKKKADVETDYVFNICLDKPEKIEILNIILDLFIVNNCVYYTNIIDESYEINLFLYDNNKDLFYKCYYWVFNSDLFDYENDHVTYILALARDNKFIQITKKIISEGKLHRICIPIDTDPTVVEFICETCKKNMTMKEYNSLIISFSYSIFRFCDIIIKNHGITFFKLMNKYNILESYVLYLNKTIHDIYYQEHYYFIKNCLKTNQTDILDYLKKYGLSLKNFKFHGCKMLISMIKKDNEETFIYCLKNLMISNKIIRKTIENSGDFITKEYVDILYNNEKLDAENLILLSKYIKNNPDANLKKYVKKLNLI